ncbi:copper-transporting ATPase HMA4-like isoform X2 [Phoenix dactylifera]|nr:copper-transporting ATPase HMA4-like isoform X2 [Phoenix dactylifera]
METNGKNNLRAPLLRPSEDVAVNFTQGSPRNEKNTRKVMFRIRGIKCASCVVSIESAIGNMKGIESISVSPIQGQAVIRYRPEFINAKTIKEAIEDLHYEVDEFPEQEICVCLLRIKGMACTSCSESVERALLMVDGVKKAVVGLALEEAKIHFDPNVTDSDHLIEAIEDAGFGADLISSGDDLNKVHLKLEGLRSPEDAILIQSSLEATEGVNHVEIDPMGQKVTVAYDPDLTGPRSLIRCIEETGQGPNFFNARLHTPSRRRETERHQEIRAYKNLFLWSCLFSIPVLVFSMVLPMLSPIGDWLSYKLYNNLTTGIFLRWVLCTPVQFIIGWRFYIGSYHALKRGSSNMDVLVALGTNAAYFYSVYIVIKASTSRSFEGQDFFETSAMLISFILLGKYLEVMAKGKTSDALAKLTDLAPETAFLLNMNGDGNVISETEISTQLLQRNDVIKIVPGAKVPVDGIVIKGQSHVNESMITGEAKAIAKRPGDKVIGGTVNENGCILVKATHVGSDTALSQIVQLVEAAQLARAPVQKLADKISRFFVPTVVVAAFLTWLGWFIPGEAHLLPRSWIPKAMDGFELALQFGISVLVVACPCALGLATPTAVMVATGKGASQGVLIKGGNALEKAHKVKTVVFDKTGTLTVGKPAVVHTKIFTNMPLQEFCNWASAAEANSEHPLAKAVVGHAKKLHQLYGSYNDHTVEAKDFEVHPGAGVSANIGGKMVLVGNKRLMLAFQVPVSPEVQDYMSDAENLARTCVLVAVDGMICGAFAVSDPLKPEAGHVISFLNSMSISSIMVTGDNWATANVIARELGISTVFAETDPVGKAEKIKELQMKGLTVAMVGDGINDSPALVAADVGMAIGAGTDIAIEAADVVLMKSNLEDVITAIDLSRKTISRIKLNYMWALGYNILGMPVAAGVLFPFTGIRLPPWLAGACMAASSLSVVCSSLLLQSYKKPLHIQDVQGSDEYSSSV